MTATRLTLETDAMGTASLANAPSLTPTLRAASRRSLFWIAAGVCALLVSIVATLMAGGSVAGGRPLAADNAAQAGSMALVEVLRQQGVAVTVADTFDQARAAAAGAADPTLFFYDEQGYLLKDQLAAMAGLASRVVLADPDFLTLQTLAPEVGFGGVSGAESLAASCAVPAAVTAGSISPGGSTLTLIQPNATGQDATAVVGCFPSGEKTFSLIERTASARTLTLVADTSVFSNDEIATWGNAALALNLLGESDALVWYLPTIADVSQTGPPSIGELTPGWVTPTLLLLVAVALSAFVWRGRRFGPLVAENLPVTVKASETMEGRARLYERGNARLHSVDALRIGAVQRLARQLGLGRNAGLDDVVLSVAAITGRAQGQVRAVLVDAVPASDGDFITLSDQLQDLELATTRATTPQPYDPQPYDPQPYGRMNP